MEQNTVILSLDKYDEMKTRIRNFENSHEILNDCLSDLKAQNDALIDLVLEENLDTYNIRNYSLEKITDFNGWDFGLRNKKQLRELIGEKRMIEFIKAKKEEYEKEQEEEQENDD